MSDTLPMPETRTDDELNAQARQIVSDLAHVPANLDDDPFFRITLDAITVKLSADQQLLRLVLWMSAHLTNSYNRQIALRQAVVHDTDEEFLEVQAAGIQFEQDHPEVVKQLCQQTVDLFLTHLTAAHRPNTDLN
jgi:hypothetical protein